MGNQSQSGITLVRQVQPPVPPRPGLTSVGRAGALAVKGRNGVAWVRRGAQDAATFGGRAISGTIRRGAPWLIGGEVAWEIGRQVWSGLRNGQLYDEDGQVVGSLADGCLYLGDILSDVSMVKKLVRDLNDLRSMKTGEDLIPADSAFAKAILAGTYTLTEEGTVVVMAYATRRASLGVDFLFDPSALGAVYFNAIYASCVDPGNGSVVPPEGYTWVQLNDTIQSITSSVVDDSLVFDGYRQLIDLDAWLKLYEFLERMKTSGRSGIDASAEGSQGSTKVVYDSPSQAPVSIM